MNPDQATIDPLTELRRVTALLSPYGLVSGSLALPRPEGEPGFEVYAASLGDPSKVLDNLRGWNRGADMGNMNGAGSALTPERARLVSLAESLERYSTCAWDEGGLTVASESELDVEYVSPSRWPRCSAEELRSEHCGLREYDPTLPIRWVRGWSLTRRREVLVPAQAVYMHMPERSPSERFTRGITTGSAVHTDLRSAVLGGLLEVVERDSISLVWLRRLRLPELSVDAGLMDPIDGDHVREGASGPFDVRFFDATTDFGVPVVYALQLSDVDERIAQVVCATCESDPGRAVAKIYRELASLRVAVRAHAAGNPVVRPEPGEVSVAGGAAYNADISRRRVFDFLLRGERERRHIATMPGALDKDDPLGDAVERLADRGAEVLAVDITTDEARQVGMHAVKVVVPEAMPLSFIHAERYLATERLRTAPRAMGVESHGPEFVNPEPQPFA
ncbi:YcaO-like family protein [Nocardiopsis alba]|uniref:TpaC n=1 Tax=Nocardiopsis sp. TFS65-07 TaxID=756929 RepID=E3UME6_9ACTN|nr:YcaO-like family protein [Nocardiopsis alba]ADO67772.1 TpaC [Nocardiopsis sp. TFS65-07]